VQRRPATDTGENPQALRALDLVQIKRLTPIQNDKVRRFPCFVAELLQNGADDATEVHLTEVRFGQMKRLGAQAVTPGFRILPRVAMRNERGEEAMRRADVKPHLLAQLGDADLAPAISEGVQQCERSRDGLDRFALPIAFSAVCHPSLSHENATSFSFWKRSRIAGLQI